MAIVKVIEVISEGKTVDAALESAVKEASKTVKNITQVNVEHIAAIVENNHIKNLRVNSKISFIVDDKER